MAGGCWPDDRLNGLSTGIPDEGNIDAAGDTGGSMEGKNPKSFGFGSGESCEGGVSPRER